MACVCLAVGCQFETEGRSTCDPARERTCFCPSKNGEIQLCITQGETFAGCRCIGSEAQGAIAVEAGSADAGAGGKPAQVAPRAMRDAGVPIAGTAGSWPGAAGSGGSGSPQPATSVGGAAAAPGIAGAAGGGELPGPMAVALTTEPEDEASYVFDPTQVRTYDLRIDPADLAAIDMQPSAEAWVPASLQFEGKLWGPYRVRYKGSAGSFKWPCTANGRNDPKAGRCSMKLDFNETDPEARFYGLKKLNFHSMITDGSLLRDRLGYSLFREHGIAAPRAVHARVLINGQLEGVFVVVEQVDGRFTRARFGDGGEGNVYKEVWPLFEASTRYLSALETNEDEAPVVDAMVAFKQAIDAQAPLESFLDAAYTARYVAVDRVIVNDDGVFHFYCDPAAAAGPDRPPGNHNYYWYETAIGPRFWLIPWDLDYAFDGSPWVRLQPKWNVAAPCTCTMTPGYGWQTPASCDPLVKRFIELNAEVEREIDAFLSGPFAKDRVDAKLSAWQSQIQPAVVEAAGIRHAPTEATWAAAVIELGAKIDATRAARGTSF